MPVGLTSPVNMATVPPHFRVYGGLRVTDRRRKWCAAGRAVTPQGESYRYVTNAGFTREVDSRIQRRSIVKGRILEIRPREVLVDIGYKSEGVIPIAEFDDIDSLEVGDEVEVLLERLENDEGMVMLSKEKAAYRQNWNKIAAGFCGRRLDQGQGEVRR